MKSRKSGFAFVLVGLVLMLTPMASAQTTDTAVPGAITVTGEGTARVPAEEALVVITIGTDGTAFFDPATGMPIESAESTEIDATPIIDAMVAYGVPVNDISVEEMPFSGEWGSGTMPLPIMIVATIPDPTVENLSGLLNVVREAAGTAGVFVNQFGVMYSIADCRPLRQQARVDAVANARMEAEDQAAALNTTVSEVTASRDVIPMTMGSYQANSCDHFAPMKPFPALYVASPFDPGMPAEVSVTVAIEVSYEIP